MNGLLRVKINVHSALGYTAYLVVQIIALALEFRMRCLFNNKDDVTGDDARRFVSLFGEGDCCEKREDVL